MAKEDFCFTYYDGDAARDTTHMNRLERGAYHDIVISQRKFGHLTIDQLKKILGKDFTECWPAIELILKVDGDGKFFIDWLEASITKAKKHSKKQRQNVTKRYQNVTKDLPEKILVTPLGDGNGDGDVIVINYKESENKKIISETEIIEDETLMDATHWTNQVIEGNDVVFMESVRTRNIQLNGALEKLARDHLDLCSRYEWHKKFSTQQAFRNSLLKHVSDETSKKTYERQGTKGTTTAASTIIKPGKSFGKLR